jgi:cytochrome c peroxidase
VAATAGLTLRGQVELPDRQDYSGVKVNAGSQTVTTEADGAFLLPLAAGQPYTLHLSAPGCLSLQVNGQPLTGSGAFDLGRLVMLGGDATGDDRVDLADLSFVNSRLGSQDSQADLNGDRQVDKLDVAPILANYGRQGPIRMGAPVKPAGVISGAEMPPLSFGSAPDPNLVKLGQALFFDRILSGNRDIACSTCHLPGQNSSDSLSLSIGTGAKGGLGPQRELGSGRPFIPRNALDIFNRGASEWHTMFWDSRLSGSPETGFVTPARSALPPGLDSILAVQAMFPVTSRDEMRGRLGDVSVTGPPNELAALGDQDFTGIWAVLLARLLAIPEYVALFQAAYPDTPLGEFGFQHAANAIAAFEQDAFTFANSPWDQYLTGDQEALSEPARRGAELFFGQAGCARCHSGNLFTDQEHHNLGVPQLGPGKGDEAPLDLGRARETQNPLDRFAFRTPSLRNVTVTGPWMHNGAYTSLEDAVRHHFNPEQALRAYNPNQLIPNLRNTVKIDEATVTTLLMTLDPLVESLPHLTDQEVDDLLAFLEALTDPTAAHLDDIVPASVPSGLPVDQ